MPFFGDQFFWGDRIHKRGLGPEPIPIYELNVDLLSNAIRFMLDPEVIIFGIVGSHCIYCACAVYLKSGS